MERLIKITEKLGGIYITDPADMEFMAEYFADHNIKSAASLGGMADDNWNTGPNELYSILSIGSDRNLKVKIHTRPTGTVSEVMFIEFNIAIENIIAFEDIINNEFEAAVERAYEFEESTRRSLKMDAIRKFILEEK